VTWRDVTWRDVTWCDVRWRDVTWRDLTWGDLTWREVTWRDVTWGDVCRCRWRDILLWCSLSTVNWKRSTTDNTLSNHSTVSLWSIPNTLNCEQTQQGQTPSIPIARVPPTFEKNANSTYNFWTDCLWYQKITCRFANVRRAAELE